MILRDWVEKILGYGAMLVIMALLAIGSFIAVSFIGSFIPTIYAAPSAKYQEPGCEKLGTVDTIEIDRCTDGVNVWLANSAGMISGATK